MTPLEFSQVKTVYTFYVFILPERI